MSHKQQQIESKLIDALPLAHLEVINESSNHNVPPGAESHFKVVLVSSAFEGMKLIERHRSVNSILQEELREQIHALAIHTYTESEWQAQHGEAPPSAPCANKESPPCASKESAPCANTPHQEGNG